MDVSDLEPFLMGNRQRMYVIFSDSEADPFMDRLKDQSLNLDIKPITNDAVEQGRLMFGMYPFIVQTYAHECLEDVDMNDIEDYSARIGALDYAYQLVFTTREGVNFIAQRIIDEFGKKQGRKASMARIPEGRVVQIDLKKGERLVKLILGLEPLPEPLPKA